MPGRIPLLALTMLFLTSCEKYRDLDNLEVTENSFAGSISVTGSPGDADGIYNGVTDSGTYAFIWDNPSKATVLNVDALSAGSGSIRFILADPRGNEVLNETVGSGESKAFSAGGKKGKWKVTIVFSSFSGKGIFELNPVN